MPRGMVLILAFCLLALASAQNLTDSTIQNEIIPCECSEDGMSGGVQALAGCAFHSGADFGEFCFVVGGERCDSAKPSERFPGAAVRPCGEGSDQGPCACSEDGVSGNTTAFRGCEFHSGADFGRFCYVVGGTECAAAKVSERFPGAAVKPC